METTPGDCPQTTRVSRRAVLAGAAVGAGAAALPDAVFAAEPAADGPILKPLPERYFTVFGTNAEMRWDSVDHDRYLTPQPRLFVRNHTRTPRIDPRTYRLSVFGDGLKRSRAADDALSLSLHDLRRLPRTRATTVHECTGNGRSFYGSQQGTPASGTQWKLGSVGTVTWEGVRLSDVLRRLGVSADAVDVMATGLDPTYVDKEVDYGQVRRPLPIHKALDDALLAWGMNGRRLLPDHGFPLRLVVPGWVGVASIKWLGSLEVSRTRLTSPWNTKWYRMTGGDWPADSPPLTVNPVRSAW
ncbi:MAG: molybdopterin-dependent oxidoreductase, partial [Marmoricola sp.]